MLGLGGYATSGKDSVADYMVEGLGWKKLFMSQFLLEAMLKLNPVIWVPFSFPEALESETWGNAGSWENYRSLFDDYGYEKTKELPEVRKFLQVLGTEVGREMFGENVWVDMVFTKAREYQDAGFNVVVTGIRFPNELVAIESRENNGVSVWVDRPGVGAVNSHSSDNSLGPNDFDLILNNAGTLGDLPHIVDEFLMELVGD